MVFVWNLLIYITGLADNGSFVDEAIAQDGIPIVFMVWL
jgi:hypothetical protein